MIRFILAGLILPNLPFWILGEFSAAASRGLFNIEYLGWVCVALFAPSVVIVIGLSLSFLLEMAYTFASIFYLRESDIVSAAKFVLVAPWQRILLIGSMLLLASLAWAFLIAKLLPLRHSVKRLKAAAILIAAMFMLAGVDLWSGTNALLQLSDHRSAINIASSPGLRFARSTYDLWRTRHATVVPRTVESATHAVSAFQSATHRNRRRDAVLIVVESYGLALDPAISELLQAPFLAAAVAEKYRVEFGAIPFAGATVSAEMRELCGVSSGIRVSPDDPRLARCLPEAMKASGYHAIAIHGFHSSLFDRRDWYPRLGFDEIYFLEDFAGQSSFPHCSGPFPGICDDAIADSIGEYLVGQRNHPVFIYWLTLNSHLPIEHTPAIDAALRCETSQAQVHDADVCGLMALLYKTNLAIARAAARPDLPPTEFLVVGDHAPPFVSTRRRILFSQRDVPYVHLTPRQDGPGLQPLHVPTAIRP